jgi:hypothetical protein
MQADLILKFGKHASTSSLWHCALANSGVFLH